MTSRFGRRRLRGSLPTLRRPLSTLAVGALIAVACGDAGSEAAVVVSEPGTDPCDWPTFGHGNDRTFSYPCDSGISPDSVEDLHRVWFVETGDAVTAAPVVADGTLYVGDWAGRFYALDGATGDERWTYDADPSPTVYAGQITASAAVADTPGGDRVVVFNGGRTVHALSATDGAELWTHVLGAEGDPTEIETAPLVVGDTVIITYDVHNASLPAGVVALDLETGAERWYFDPEDGDHRGCGDVWGAASVDLERRLVFFGGANCNVPDEGWTAYSEAIVAVDLDTGEPRWSFQPHEPNNDDTDFAGAPVLYTAEGRDLVGLGNKDATFYAVDRDTGESVWETQATEPNNIRPGFASGGFIGPAAYADGVIAGGTGVGPCPCMHGLDAATGEILWQQEAVGPTYAPSTEVGGVVFVGSLDFTLRALDLRTGEVLWSDALTGLVSGGVAVVGDDVWAVAGFREPGSPGPSENSGVFRYSVDPSVEPLTGLPPSSTTAAPAAGPTRLIDAAAPCIGEPCELGFDFKEPPTGITPTATLTIEPDPFRVTIETSGLGPPEGWLRPGSPATDVGAEAYVLMISERDDEPNGGFLCILEDGTCTATTVPDPGASYNRISLLALADAGRIPDPADGFDRLVTTISFDEPLQTEATG
jgi:outer membrane protein assembly factor BamB